MSMTASEAKRVVWDQIGNWPGVAGVGIGWDARGRSCIRVNVNPNQITPTVRAQIPKEMDGVQIEVFEVLQVRAAVAGNEIKG